MSASDTVKVFGSPRSRLTRVSWMCQELDQNYEVIPTKPHTPEMRALNAAGKGPVLVDGDITVIDSAAICIYLADKNMDKNMSAAPATADRAALDSWLHFAQNDLEAPLWLKMKHNFILPEEFRADVSAVTKMEFKNAIRAMDARLGANLFAIGDRFTAADVVLGHAGSWARSAKFAIESDRVNAYFDRILAREGLARAREIEKDM